ncbi:hypothetical protein [Streptomyces sp. cg35]|uniref:hypothetical protein n=1 Tax=Streptomyces sp. cg35 TaxID=3421650 RepID=UPI003D17EA34
MPRPPAHPEPFEIACDESGSDGENLVNGNTDVFAHASVRLEPGPAAEGLRETVDRISSPARSAATEYKANVLLRGKHRATLTWLLGPAGPILGRAHVHLTDKRYFVVDRAVGLLADGDPAMRSAALAAHRAGPRTFGPERWRDFLDAANDLLRTGQRTESPAPVDAFFATVDALLAVADAAGPAGEFLALLRRTRPRAESLRTRAPADPGEFPALDPLFPALVGTVAHWSAGGHRVTVVHDRQNMLTDARVGHLKQTCGGALADLRLVEASHDARVQLADFLAGAARKIASDTLAGHDDEELTALLRPYVNRSSLWAGPAPLADGPADPQVAGHH